ncbi:MAG TPA: 16S rRNA (guanine(527)-N(7))-methyltransferase RsmG [Allosphingosinicella sp.]|jgi:16S rRNA (guanine527-N7)-methyltransferase
MMDEFASKEALGVPRETVERLEAFVDYLAAENERQNLVSRGTLGSVWSRHIYDSAQLLRFAPSADASWIDLGTGAGFPGLIIAALHGGPVTLVEARKLRADFLREGAEILGVEDRTDIYCAKVEAVETGTYDVISARAFAPLPKLLALGEKFAAPGTRWVLPKGRNAKSELDAARASWQGAFRVEPSLTDAEAGIIVAEEVRSLKRGKQSR